MPEPDEAQADGSAPENDRDLLLFVLKQRIGVEPSDYVGPNAVQFAFGILPDVTERAVGLRSDACVRDPGEYRGSRYPVRVLIEWLVADQVPVTISADARRQYHRHLQDERERPQREAAARQAEAQRRQDQAAYYRQNRPTLELLARLEADNLTPALALGLAGDETNQAGPVAS
jgi:hypothetical protein